MTVAYTLSPPTNSAPVANLATRRAIVEAYHPGGVTWVSPSRCFAHCPGENLHNSHTGKKDYMVNIDGAPSGSCFHDSCQGPRDERNRQMRVEIFKAENGGELPKRRRRSEDEIAAEEKVKAQARLAARAKAWLPKIIAENQIDEVALSEDSPTPLPIDPSDDWRCIVRLFQPQSVLWIADETFQSGERFRNLHTFRTAADWLQWKNAPGKFICPNTFEPGAINRADQCVAGRCFLVAESDKLKRPDAIAVAWWLRGFLTLRALVDTAGKSVHSWWDYPTPDQLAELRVILPAMQFDSKMFGPSQPCRLPGAMRGEKRQRLLWLNLEGTR